VIEAVVIGRVGIDLYPNQLSTPLRDVRTYTRFVGGFAGNTATGLARLGVRVAIWQISLEDVDLEEMAAAAFLYATGTGLAQSPSRETTLTLLEGHRGTSVFDLDWRPSLWERPEEFPELANRAAAAADLVVGNEEEVDAARLDEVPVLVLKRGEHGATVYERGEESNVPAWPVEVVNGLGAGDAFASAMGHGLLRGLSLVEAVRRGTVAGAIVVSQLACSEAMPRLEELEAALV
jgi:5-dehydro-2-deoxygluconokinase